MPQIRFDSSYFNRWQWVLPNANSMAVQLNWAALPAYGRYWKFFTGRPKGVLPNSTYGYVGLGQIPFRGMALSFNG